MSFFRNLSGGYLSVGEYLYVCVVAAGLLVGFSAAAHSREKEFYAFRGGNDGAVPVSPVIADNAGNLYGTTVLGGAGTLCYENNGQGCGTIFELAPSGTESVLYAFTGGTDGALPLGGLVADSEGNIYGTASTGGSNNCSGGCGTIFELASDGTETTLYAFQGGSDGEDPAGSMIFDQNGNLYGTTMAGGGQGSDCNSNGCGTVFELASTGKEAVLYAFKGGTDGWAPIGSLIADSAGNLYGVTTLGGVNCPNSDKGCGTVFRIAPDGTETQLHAFQGGSDGFAPQAGLVSDAAGNLYGTTVGGGVGCTNGCGTVYELAKGKTESVLYSFRGGNDGRAPESSLILDHVGNLYGTTYFGGDAQCHGGGCGTVFKLAPDGTETVLYAFGKGRYPEAGLLSGVHHFLYGTTRAGGAFTDGIVFGVKK